MEGSIVFLGKTAKAKPEASARGRLCSVPVLLRKRAYKGGRNYFRCRAEGKGKGGAVNYGSLSRYGLWTRRKRKTQGPGKNILKVEKDRYNTLTCK